MEAQRPKMSYAAYLAQEKQSEVRHEYLRGEVFAMAGGTPEHSFLAAAMNTQLGMRVAGGPCRVFNSDLRIRIEETDFSCYPDVTIVCGEIRRSPLDADAITNPALVVEVLSESTAAYDRGPKLAHYKQCPSLREILFVSQQPQRVEVWRRANGYFEVFDLKPGEALDLRSINATIPVDDIYRDLPQRA